MVRRHVMIILSPRWERPVSGPIPGILVWRGRPGRASRSAADCRADLRILAMTGKSQGQAVAGDAFGRRLEIHGEPTEPDLGIK